MQEQQQAKPMQGLAVLTALIHLFAMPHELVWRVPGTFGRKYLGLGHFIMIVIGYPLFTELANVRRDSGSAVMWFGSIGLFFFHAFAARVNRKPRHSFEIGKSWVAFFTRDTLLIATLETGGSLFVNGMLIGPISHSFFVFMFVSAFANMLHLGLLGQRRVEIRQAYIDAREEAGEFREATQRYR